MDLINKGGYNLRNLSKVNIILGKNGCGKSTALKALDLALRADGGYYKYLSPERGGTLLNNASLEQSVLQSGPNWISDTLRNNQFNQFKEQSVLQYKNLEKLILKEIEKNSVLRSNHGYTFDTIVSKINTLLANIEIRRTETDFELINKITGNKISAANISSGESELISLGIECLYFAKKSPEEQTNILFIDEPDVHLHPDLQVRFTRFITDLVEDGHFSVIISTHSTSILGALSNYTDSRFCFMLNGQKDFDFNSINETYTRILPIFGAHPLSNLFNESPILLLEGEDDVRIWQQAIRTSINKLKLFPCSVDTIDNLSSYEDEVVSMLNSVYDSAKGYSLRDRDDEAEEIDDKPPVIRFRLSCRNSENLLLTDEVLATLNTNWDDLQTRIETWINANPTHPKHLEMQAFRDQGFDRKNHQIKHIRNDLTGLANSNKAWEIVIGQTIGRMSKGEIPVDYSENKLANYLGNKTTRNLLTEQEIAL